MKPHALLALLAWSLLAILPAAAQSNAVLDEILARPSLRFQDLAYLALTSAGEEVTSPADAPAALAVKFKEYAKWPADAEVRLGDFCHVMMQVHKLPYGLWYSLFPGPRYALREFVFLGLAKNPVWPSRKLGGEEALRLLGTILEWKETHQ